MTNKISNISISRVCSAVANHSAQVVFIIHVLKYTVELKMYFMFRPLDVIAIFHSKLSVSDLAIYTTQIVLKGKPSQ